jgi:hypothetical protein
VKNNLQMISALLYLHGKSVGDISAQEALLESQNRVQSMAMIHQNLYQDENLLNVGVKEYLDKLFQHLFSSYNIEKSRIAIHKNIEIDQLDVDTIVPLALIVNELISNALKYAFRDGRRGDLHVYIGRHEGHIDVVIPYKQHHVTDLERPVADLLGRHHRRSVQKALRRVEVSTCPAPFAMLDEWCILYGQLSARHGITGLRAFSRVAFERQFGVPGMVGFRASVDGETVGLHLWYVRDQVAYGHLGATSARGYEYMASYALYWHAIEYFGERVRWLDLGGVPGLSDGESAEGLRRFKAGWATDARPTFLCGRVLQSSAYARLTRDRVVGKTTYFPAYRCGEFSSSSSSLGRIDVSTWR